MSKWWKFGAKDGKVVDNGCGEYFHDFQPRFDEGATEHGRTLIYVHDICIDCGKVVARATPKQ